MPTLRKLFDRGELTGIHADGVETAARWRDAGFRMITIASDGALLRQAAASAIAAVRGVYHRPEPPAASVYA